jgi:hypothetical protein
MARRTKHRDGKGRGRRLRYKGKNGRKKGARDEDKKEIIFSRD